MPYSRVSYTGDGTTAEYTLPFPLLSIPSLQVRVAGTLKTVNTDYTVNTSTSKVTFLPGKIPAGGATISLKRVTPRGVNDRLVVFTDPSNLNAETLNKSDLQLLFIVQEALDDIADGVGVGIPGSGGEGGSVPDAIQSQLDELFEELDTANDALLAEVAARTAALLADHEAWVAAILAEASNRNAAILSAKTTLETADSALASQITVLNAQVNDATTGLPNAHARVTSEQTARASADSAMASNISTLQATVGDHAARITTVEGALSGGDSNEALAFRVSTLEAQVQTPTTGALAKITTEEAARASADTALSTRVTTLESTATSHTGTLSSLSASLSSEATTRANQDTALAGSITTVTATANSALSTANSASSTANSANTTAVAAQAAVTAETAARVSADTALSASITSLTATVSGVSASVTTEASARVSGDNAINANLATRWGVNLDGNGRVVGRIRLDGNATSSSLEFTSDALRVSHPSAPNVFFPTMNRVVGTSTQVFNSGSSYGFNHMTPVTLYGPAHASAAGNPSAIANVRSGAINVLILARIINQDGLCTIYWRKNNSGAYVALAAGYTVNGAVMSIARGADMLSGVSATDSFQFYVAPCDGSGNISVTTGTLITELDVLSFNW